MPFFKNLFAKKSPKCLPTTKADDIYTEIIECLRIRSLKTLDDNLQRDDFQINEAREEYNHETRGDPWTLLMRIASEFDSKFLLYLVDDYKAKTDLVTPKNGHTALILAVKNDKVDNVRTLCVYNCNKDITDYTSDGNSALHYACISGNVEIMQLLIGNIGRKANLNIKNSYGKTPMDVACWYGRSKICKILESAMGDTLQQGNEPRSNVSGEQNQRMPVKCPVPTEHSEIKGAKPKKRSPNRHGGAAGVIPSSSEDEQLSLTVTQAIQESSFPKMDAASFMEGNNGSVGKGEDQASLLSPNVRDSGCYSKEHIPITLQDHTNMLRNTLSMGPRLTHQQRAYSYHCLDRNFPMQQGPSFHGNKF